MRYENYFESVKRRAKKIVQLRKAGLTFQFIGEREGISRQRAAQIYKNEIEKLSTDDKAIPLDKI